MSDVIAVRVSKKLKEELRELSIDYAQETRACLEALVKKKKLEDSLKRAERLRNKLKKKAGTFPSSADFIREDRENGH